MQEGGLEIRLAAFQRNRQVQLSIGELGVLLTGVNRALNKAAAAKQNYNYSPQAEEPSLVRAHIVEVRNGSVILNLVTQLADKIVSVDFVAGVAGNAAWDLTKFLGRELERALRRVGKNPQPVERVEPSFDAASLDPPELRGPGQVTFQVTVITPSRTFTMTYTAEQPD